jgi:hypothetical protein
MLTHVGKHRRTSGEVILFTVNKISVPGGLLIS